MSDGHQDIPVPVHVNDLKLYKARPRRTELFKNIIVSGNEEEKPQIMLPVDEGDDKIVKKRKRQ